MPGVEIRTRKSIHMRKKASDRRGGWTADGAGGGGKMRGNGDLSVEAGGLGAK